MFFSRKKNKLNPIQELMLALLRAQLWLKPVDDIQLPGCGKGVELSEAVSSGMHSQSEGCEYSSMTDNKNDTDEDILQQWNELMDLGYRQTVICFISAACLRHKDVDKIPAEIREEMEAVLEENKKIHEYHNKTIVEVFTLLEDNGLHPILLKGQGLAQLYPQPELRQCGDIDIFIGPKDYEKACCIMDEYCGPEAKQKSFYEDQLHYHISNGSVTFEIHRKAADAAVASKDIMFNEWAFDCMSISKCICCNIDDTSVHVPEKIYDIIYTFDHLLKHLVMEGVNLRQFCDWMMLVNLENKEINSHKLYELINKYSSVRAWQILGGILVYQLGMAKIEFPLWNEQKAKKSQSFVLSEIIQGAVYCFGTKIECDYKNAKSYITKIPKFLNYYYKLSKPLSIISYSCAIDYYIGQIKKRI